MPGRIRSLVSRVNPKYAAAAVAVPLALIGSCEGCSAMKGCNVSDSKLSAKQEMAAALDRDRLQSLRGQIDSCLTDNKSYTRVEMSVPVGEVDEEDGWTFTGDIDAITLRPYETYLGDREYNAIWVNCSRTTMMLGVGNGTRDHAQLSYDASVTTGSTIGAYLAVPTGEDMSVQFVTPPEELIDETSTVAVYMGYDFARGQMQLLMRREDDPHELVAFDELPMEDAMLSPGQKDVLEELEVDIVNELAPRL